MQVQALSFGPCATATRFAGAVHSVFARACNADVGGGRMVTLLAPEMGNLPAGIRLDLAAGFAFSHHLRAGMKVGCRGGIVRFAGSDLVVDTGPGSPWQAELAGLEVNRDRPSVAAACRLASAALRRRVGIDPWTDPSLRAVDVGVVGAEMRPLLTAAQRALPSLLQATRRHDADRAAMAADSFIGVGHGLTPAGDDFLMGFLNGLWATARSGRELDFVRVLGQALLARAHATTTLSKALLRDAALGMAPQRMRDVIRAIAEGDRTETRHAVEAAFDVGHTSGSDGLLGLLVAVAARAERP